MHRQPYLLVYKNILDGVIIRLFIESIYDKYTNAARIFRFLKLNRHKDLYYAFYIQTLSLD